MTAFATKKHGIQHLVCQKTAAYKMWDDLDFCRNFGYSNTTRLL